MKRLFGTKQNKTEPIVSPLCPRCRGARTALTQPTSPEAMTYRCYECDGEWSIGFTFVAPHTGDGAARRG